MARGRFPVTPSPAVLSSNCLSGVEYRHELLAFLDLLNTENQRHELLGLAVTFVRASPDSVKCFLGGLVTDFSRGGDAGERLGKTEPT